MIFCATILNDEKSIRSLIGINIKPFVSYSVKKGIVTLMIKFLLLKNIVVLKLNKN